MQKDYLANLLHAMKTCSERYLRRDFGLEITTTTTTTPV